MTSTEGRIRIDPGALALDEKNPSKKSARHHVQNVQNLMLSMEQSVKQLFFFGYYLQNTPFFLNKELPFWPQWQWCIPQISAVPGVWINDM